MICSAIAAGKATWLGLRYASQLGIKVPELGRYFLKSINLGLCYGGFISSVDLRKALRAGDVAFCCCAYDVVTDWRSFDSESRDTFEVILSRHVPEWARVLTKDLYQKELNQTIGLDGLERGVLALEFAVGVIGLQEQFSSADVREMGVLLQIVDDVLDFEQDCALGELNCLNTPRSRLYLRHLATKMDALSARFSHSLVMRLVLDKVQHRIKRRVPPDALSWPASRDTPFDQTLMRR